MGNPADFAVVEMNRPALRTWLIAGITWVLAVGGIKADSLSSLAEDLSDELKKKGEVSVAVLGFPYARGRWSTGSQLFSERMVTYLSQSGAVVIERRLLPAILKERRLWESGIINQAALKQMGQIKNVDALVIGTLFDFNPTQTQLSVRIIQVESGQILTSGSVRAAREWEDDPRLPPSARTAVPLAAFDIDTEEEKPVENELIAVGSRVLPKYNNTGPARRATPLKKKHLTMTGSHYRPAPVPYLVPRTVPSPGGKAK